MNTEHGVWHKHHQIQIPPTCIQILQCIKHLQSPYWDCDLNFTDLHILHETDSFLKYPTQKYMLCPPGSCSFNIPKEIGLSLFINWLFFLMNSYSIYQSCHKKRANSITNRIMINTWHFAYIHMLVYTYGCLLWGIDLSNQAKDFKFI